MYLKPHTSRLKEVYFFLCTVSIYLELPVHASQSGHLLRLVKRTKNSKMEGKSTLLSWLKYARKKKQNDNPLISPSLPFISRQMQLHSAKHVGSMITNIIKLKMNIFIIINAIVFLTEKHNLQARNLPQIRM